MPDHNPPPPVAVPLDLVVRLHAGIAGLLHDWPVQDVVAGTLLLETARATGDDALLERGLVAVGRAAQRTRDVMWMLQAPTVRPTHLYQDLADLVDRVGAADVEVIAENPWPVDAVAVLVAAIHAILVDVLVGRGRAHRLVVSADDAGVQAVLAAEHGTVDIDRPWPELADAHLAAAGGRRDTTVRGGITVTRLVVPAQPPA